MTEYSFVFVGEKNEMYWWFFLLILLNIVVINRIFSSDIFIDIVEYCGKKFGGRLMRREDNIQQRVSEDWVDD